MEVNVGPQHLASRWCLAARRALRCGLHPVEPPSTEHLQRRSGLSPPFQRSCSQKSTRNPRKTAKPGTPVQTPPCSLQRQEPGRQTFTRRQLQYQKFPEKLVCKRRRARTQARSNDRLSLGSCSKGLPRIVVADRHLQSCYFLGHIAWHGSTLPVADARKFERGHI